MSMSIKLISGEIMKSFLFSILIISILSCSATQPSVEKEVPKEQKVRNDLMQFHHNDAASLTKIVELANSENKLIFVDVYADWCGPCKLMDADVFSNEDTADFMKDNFINYKVDGEKYNGPNLGVMYGVASYPTLLILDQKGHILERSDGMIYQTGLLRMARSAIKKSKEQL